MENIIIKVPISADEVIASNTKTKSKTLGDVEFKHVSFGDSETLERFLNKAGDEQDFALAVLHHQLITPKLTLIDFSKIPSEELIKLARAFVKKEQYLFQYFKEATDEEFFMNFKKAILEYYLTKAKPLRATFLPNILSTKNILQNFDIKYKDIIGQSSYIRESISGISAATKAFQESQLNIAQSFKPILEQYQLTGAFLSKILAPQIDSWDRNIRVYGSMLDDYADLWRNLDKKYENSEQEAVKILRKYKWFITLSMPMKFVFIVVQIGRRKGNQRKLMNKLFVDYYTTNNFSNLEILMKRWESNAIFKPRMKILWDCIFFLRNSKRGTNPSNVVIPTLIAQIDGIQNEFMKQQGLTYEKLKLKNAKGETIDWKKWFKDQPPNNKMDELTKDIHVNFLFQKALPGQSLATPFTFNRHKIMHGESLKYGRIDNTIRAFLMLDFFATICGRKPK